MQGPLSEWERHERRVRIERRAAAEAAWFYLTCGARVPENGSAEELVAARRIERWMKLLAPFHRGAFSLRYTAREWPTCIAEEFGELTSFVVRLECARHPAVGKSDAELEAESIARLTEAIAECSQERERRKARGRDSTVGPKEMRLGHLSRRARQHLDSAVRALAKVRGNAPCMIPEWLDPEVDECE